MGFDKWMEAVTRAQAYLVGVVGSMAEHAATRPKREMAATLREIRQLCSMDSDALLRWRAEQEQEIQRLMAHTEERPR